MSALSDLSQTGGTQTTTLPSWYNTAQQNLVTNATNATNAAPQLNQTVAQGAINTISNPNNPFSANANSLSSIASGAANPWMVDPTTGAVNPNTNTALGGLFAAQRNQFNELLPTTLAGANAGAIGSGNFGSLRGQTAVNTAAADALSKLQSQQMTAAIQNQQNAVTAGIGAGNLTNQEIANQMNIGQTQMAAPYSGASNFANILSSIKAPTSVVTTASPSAIQNLSALGSVTSGGLNALYSSGVPGTASYKPGLLDSIGKLGTSIGNYFSGDLANSGTASNPIYGRTSMIDNPGSDFQNSTAPPGLYDPVYSGNLSDEYYKAGGQVGSKGNLPVVKY